MSHYSVEDLGLVQTLPNLVTISPCDPVEAKLAARYALASDKPVYIRLAKSGEQSLHGDDLFDISQPYLMRDGGEVAIIFHGSISAEVIVAYETLKNAGRPPRLISVPTLQPLDTAALLALLDRVTHVISVEEHFTNCGLGRMVAQLKSDAAASWGLSLLGIPPHYIHAVRNTAGLRATFGLTAGDIVKAAAAVMGR
jgi:transketolase